MGRGHASIRLETASLHRWEPRHSFDLITCVHGLHYVGDKLRLIARAAAWLSPAGRFVAHLHLSNVCYADGRAMNRALLKRFRELDLTYDRRRHLLTVDGPRTIDFGYDYVGADDEAGPNFTGQRAVNSHYRG
jgi:trans-aconitate methyltransferase